VLYVLDCSVAIKWFLPEPLTDQAHSLLERFRRGTDDLVAPEILLAEFGHVLVKRTRRGELTEADVWDIWRDFNGVGVQTVPLPPIATDALRLALGHTAKYYDAVYVALARRRGCSVVTADDAMVAAFRPLGCVTALQAFAP
jgi:predicted nucleic acid-binding protein